MSTRRHLLTQALAALPPVFSRTEAVAAGISGHTLETLVRRAELVRLRRGMFCTAGRWADADRRERHVLQCLAAQRCWESAVVSHLSAAAVWGWPLPLDDVGLPWLTTPSPWTPGRRDARSGRVPARREAGLRVEAAVLTAADMSRAPGRDLCVTSQPRTVADCLRHLTALESIPIADAAAASGVSRAAIMAMLTQQAAWPFAERALAALPLVDPRRESWLESYAVVGVCGRGFPVPEAQPEVRDRSGRFVARPDCWWEELGLVLELDGRVKYRLAGLTTPSDAERLLREEKEREDRLRDLGLEVVRSGTADAVALDPLVLRLAGAMRRGGASRVTARITKAPWPAHWPARWPKP